MFKKNKFTLFFLTLVLTMLISTNVFAYTTTNLSGKDRYETSSKIALSGWTQSDYAVLASGEDYPDALCATPLAGKYKAPILLTQKDTIPAATLSTIQQLKVKNIFIIGGTSVISSNVESQLTSMGITVNRLAGNDRYGTDIKVAEQLGSVSQIAVVTGEDYADALSIAPIAVKNNMPIILIEHDSIPTEVKDYISTQNISKTYVIGKGTSILDEDGLPNVTEINGSDKYQRNIAIISGFKSSLDFSTIYLATGENFADALSGSILAGVNRNPLILVGRDITNEKNLLQLVAQNSNIKVLGGSGTIPDSTIDNINGSNSTADVTTPSTTDVSNDNVTTPGATGVTTDNSNQLIPTGVSVATVTNNVISIRWNPVVGVDYYNVYYSTDNINYRLVQDADGKAINFRYQPDFSFEFMQVPDNTTVYFKVVSVSNGMQSGFSDVVKATTLVPRNIYRWQEISKIKITSTQINCSSDGKFGYITCTVADNNGYDITNSNYMIRVRSSIGSASYKNGIITIAFPDGVDLKTINSVKIEAAGEGVIYAVYTEVSLPIVLQGSIMNFTPIN